MQNDFPTLYTVCCNNMGHPADSALQTRSSFDGETDQAQKQVFSGLFCAIAWI
jgi:hypothetical protein